MAPFMLSSGEDIVERYWMEQEVSKYLASSTSTPSPAIAMEDEATLSIENSVSHESHDVALD